MDTGLRPRLRGWPGFPGSPGAKRRAWKRRILEDPNPHPRWRALWALGAIDRTGAPALTKLVRALDGPNPVHVRNAAVGLAFFSRWEGKAELLDGLHDSDDFRRWEAVFCLRKLKNDPQVFSALSRLLRTPGEPVRVRGEAALALRGWQGGDANEELLQSLRDDPDAGVRWRAALSLESYEGKAITKALRKQLAHEQDAKVREQLQSSLAKR